MVRVVVVLLALPVVVLVVVRLLGLDRGLLATVMTVYPWVLVVGLFPLGVAAAARWWPAVATVAVVVLVGASVLVPRVLPDPQPDADGPTLTVLVANLREGRADAEVVAVAVRDHDVDVLVTPELTDDAITRLTAAGVPDPALLAPSRITSGIGVWTSIPAEVVRTRDGGRGFSRANVELVLDVAGAPPVRLTGVHPLPPINADWTRDWAAVLADVAIPTDDEVDLVAGDLNATLDHGALRDLLDRGLRDAAEVTGQAWRTTFSGIGWGEPVPPVTLDHVLVDDTVAVDEVRVLPLPGSDHRMLLATLTLPEARRASASEFAEAREEPPATTEP